MLDSTARAERIDVSASEVTYYTWEAAQKPVAVRLPMALIDRMEHEAVEAFRSLTSRGSEVGGLLLGSATPGNPSLVTVVDFELIACEYSRGPLYRLSDADLARFQQAMEKHSTGAGSRVAGFFRSHTRKGLSLDAEDLAFFEPRFLEPHHLVLLIRPFATKVSSAGIFIRENGRIAKETSYLEFPFRSSELTAAPAASVETAEPAAPTQPQPKPPARAQIVPIASRREITLPEPLNASPTPAVAEPMESAPPKPQPAAAPPAKEIEKAEKEKPAAPAPPTAPVAEKPAPKPAAAPAPLKTVVAETPAGSNKKVRMLVAAAVAMLVLAGGALVLYPMLRKGENPRPAAQQDSSPLSLRVERTSGGMLLTWNRDLPVIQNAAKVVLSITDGDRHENIALDPNQVRTGSILYPPITGDVSFQMEVSDAHQGKTTSESLRVLDPRPSPLADPSAVPTPAAKQPAPASAPQATAAAATPSSEPPAADPSAVPEEQPVSHPTIPTRKFNTESLAQRLRPVTPTDLPEAPTLARSSNSTSANLPGVMTQAAPPPLPKAAPTASAQPQPSVQGGQITPAQVISRVEPVYPKFAQQAGASGLVEVEATISVDGKVKNPHVLHGNVMLQKAAIDAVMQWRYKPAVLNGKPVESPVNIKLNFVPVR